MTDWYCDPWKVKFLAKIDVQDDGCWLWTGYHDGRYGRFYAGDVQENWAHRIAYRLHYGHPVPDGLTVDHLCRNGLCVNPLHMEVVTQAENTRRAIEARRIERTERHDATGYYSRGCRCEVCTEAFRVYQADRRAEARRRFAAGEVEIQHGTNHGYSYYLCRCDGCSEAGLAVAERFRRKAGRKPFKPSEHGSLAMYSHHKCRCEPCRENWSRYWREHRAKRKAKASA